jgi:hypothetical protein
MSEEIFPYDQWVNEALIKVLGRALEQLSDTGPMGDHHFFINIQTNHPDVDIPNFLRTQYPKEITIVLQHQFEELIVNKYGFEVSLSFSGKKSRLKIPFSSVISFADPSVNFGLQIGISTTNTETVQPKSEADSNTLGRAEAHELSDKVHSLSRPIGHEKKVTHPTQEEELSNAENSTATDPGYEPQTPKTAEVIALDTFRKK